MSLLKKRRKKITAVSASLCLTLSIAAAGCSRFVSADNDSYEEFMAARQLVTQGHYADAIGRLEKYLVRHPKAKHSSRATFFLAKAHLGANDLDQAQAAWERTIRDYPASLEAHKSKYKLALLAFLRGDPKTAYTQFKAIAESPDGPLAPEAVGFARYLAKHHR
jgi:TolA-binding protein